jgi:two-component system response regulator AtoC
VTRELARRAYERGQTHRAQPSDGPSLETSRRAAERKALVQGLEQAQGNRALAARILGISRRTLYNKLEKEGLI